MYVFVIQAMFSELTTDNFRMLQCLEWEPSGSFYQSIEISSTGQNGALAGSARVSHYSHEITDPTLPQNPRKALLYHPSTTHLIAVSIITFLSKFLVFKDKYYYYLLLENK